MFYSWLAASLQLQRQLLDLHVWSGCVRALGAPIASSLLAASTLSHGSQYVWEQSNAQLITLFGAYKFILLRALAFRTWVNVETVMSIRTCDQLCVWPCPRQNSFVEYIHHLQYQLLLNIGVILLSWACQVLSLFVGAHLFDGSLLEHARWKF